jgi:RNA polymerase sigma-54 factor
MLQLPYQQTATTTSAHLAQTMTLLSLSAAELQEKIESELASNPALELVEERRCPMCKRLLASHGSCPVCSQPSGYDSDEPIVFISPREDFYTGSNLGTEQVPEDHYASESVDLATYVLRQVAADLPVEDRLITAYILNHLDDDGFLTTTAMEVARYHHRLPSEVNEIIERLKRCDPIGVCSANPQEAMLAQIEALAETIKVPEFTREVIQGYLPKLSHQNFSEIAKQLGTSSHQIRAISSFVTENLNPFPARAHWGDVRNPSPIAPDVFHQPDVLIYYLNEDPKNPLVVEIILPIRGTLRVNPMFKASMKEMDEDKADEWRGDIEKASLLIKCIQQRSNALRLLLEKLMVYQKDYIISGDKAMKSLTRAKLAKELDVHESTISRAVSAKTVQLPNKRIVPMAIFFDRSLAYRAEIKDIIEAEDVPLSDSEIQDILAEQGIKIARRTVAKYRSMEGILPAHLRQKHNQPRA